MMDDERGVDGTDQGSETKRTGLVRIGEISAWLAERGQRVDPRDEGKYTGKKERSVIRRNRFFCTSTITSSVQ